MGKKTAPPPLRPPTPRRRGAEGEPHEVTVTTLCRDGAGRRGEAVPFLRLSGRWLERLGFQRGSRVAIAPEAGILVLTVRRTAD